MAAELKRAADFLDRFIVSLEKATNPTSGTTKPENVKTKSRDLKQKWDAYQSLYLVTEHDDDDVREAADEEFMGRFDRYAEAQGAADDLLESASSEAESVRGRSNSVSSQAGDDPTANPDRW